MRKWIELEKMFHFLGRENFNLKHVEFEVSIEHPFKHLCK